MSGGLRRALASPLPDTELSSLASGRSSGLALPWLPGHPDVTPESERGFSRPPWVILVHVMTTHCIIGGGSLPHRMPRRVPDMMDDRRRVGQYAKDRI